MALKICPACQKQVGPRTKKCDCGHEFATATSAVPASGQSMVLEPLDKRISESVESVRDIISRVESRPSVLTSRVPIPASEPTDVVQSTPTAPIQATRPRFNGGGTIVVPAGEPPVRPQGYKDKWPDGPASDEVVQNWAMDVYNSGNGRYAVDAVIYFARYFWDITGKEYRTRIRELIEKTLRPSRPDELHSTVD